MAAIIPHLEVPEDMTDLEAAYYVCTDGSKGLGSDSMGCPSPDAVLADSHAGLLAMVFLRDAVIQDLEERGLVVTAQVGDRKGTRRRDIFLVLNETVGPGPAWSPNTPNPVSGRYNQQYKLLSWTSKMNAPSWSLPAGAPRIGGSCPGAIAGQSVVDTPVEKLTAMVKTINIGLGRPKNTPIDQARAICQHCYATGGQYSTGNVQYAQYLRFLWTKAAMKIPVQGPYGPSTAFIETMVYAIDNANYKLDGGEVTETVTGEDGVERKVKIPFPAEPSGRRFFRVHDSGDFFSKAYLEQWKVITNRLPDIVFWAPSRVWAVPGGSEWINEINNPPRNFIIRPSAYEVNEAGPVNLGPGWAAPTTVIKAENNLGMAPALEEYVYSKAQRVAPATTGPDPRYDWNCQAYAVDDKKHTCRKAVAPEGFGAEQTSKGCRACWLLPDVTVNYTLH